jgi:ABC-type Mn2+/Zn2+ transport system ATPase subunit
VSGPAFWILDVRQTTVTLRNYRCFSDTTPASIVIGDGFTALVGQNNAGKSSFLKLFYEFRNLFQQFGSDGSVIGLARGTQLSTALQGLVDQKEIFCDSNDRSLAIQLDCPASGNFALSRVVIEVARNSPSQVAASFYCGQEHRRILTDEAAAFNGTRQGGFIGSPSGEYDFSWLYNLSGALGNTIYLGPFRNAINQESSAYFDIQIGSAFVGLWESWKTGNDKTQNRAISRVTQDIRRIFEFESLEIAPSPDATTLHLVINDLPYKLNEVGAGIAQFIIVLGNTMIRQPAVVLIDEPELHLHPALQLDFLTTLASYSGVGVLFATHSLGLARASSERVFSFQRKDGSSQVRPFGQSSNYAEFLGEMSFAGNQALGAEAILLVEGAQDVRTAQQFLRKLNSDHKVVVLPLGGDQLARGGIEHELSEVKRLSNTVFALVDSEREAEGGPAIAPRVDFEKTCKTLAIDVCVTARRAIENYLSDRAIKIVKGPKYRALGPYQRLADVDPAWSKSESWRIAREMSLSEIEKTDVGTFLRRIAS